MFVYLIRRCGKDVNVNGVWRKRISMGRLTPAVWLVVGVLFQSQACEIPVFRYALERWPTVPSRVSIFSSGSLLPGQRVVADAIAQSNRVELELCDVAVAPKDGDAAEGGIWSRLTEKPALPAVALSCWGGKPFVAESVFLRPLSRETADCLSQIPLHREMARRLMTGDSAVWVLLTSPDAAKNKAVRKMLDDALRDCNAALKLPHEQDPNDAKYDTPVSPNVELKLRFTVLEVPGTGFEADLIRSALRSISTNAENNAEPVAIPVFGRGLALDAFSGPTLDPQVIRTVCEFLCGACSCSVKEMRPGVSLFMPVDWDAEVTQTPLVEALPPLTVPGATGNLDSAKAPPLAPAVLPDVAQAQRMSVARSLWALLGIGLLMLVAGTLKVLSGRKGDS